MANYRPNSIQITPVHSGQVNANLSTEFWGLTFLRGVANGPSGTTIDSGAVVIWEDSTATTATADHVTFTNDSGAFGVTVKANVDLVIKVYAQ